MEIDYRGDDKATLSDWKFFAVILRVLIVHVYLLFYRQENNPDGRVNFQLEINLHGYINPEMFQNLISAAKMISGFNVETKSFKSPSLALHMGTNLKMVCDVAFKIVVEKRRIPELKWINGDETKNEIKELRKLVMAHWCKELSSLA
ncbi:hypothetical protein NQ318_015225 [Aromia moschata]|uniref:Uncharacterized protein n=1 Tax=Aromia moschata TaxID=1265417 RepID=A0AAV8XL19_9CUCU|nr:hypothetical protein NQ318_015225 [Aromia moschata]